jgi:ADP-ribose pyrophosphatase
MQKLIPAEAVLIPDNASNVFTGEIFSVYQWPQQLFDGSTHTFEMLKRTDTVITIAVDGDEIIVIDDEQPHLGTRKSFPGGRIDEGDESTLTAAQRELEEETGYIFKNWKLIKVHQPYRKVEWFVYVYVAWDMETKVNVNLDPGERITVSKVNFEDLKVMVMDNLDYLGENQDLFKIAASTEDLVALSEFSGTLVDR